VFLFRKSIYWKTELGFSPLELLLSRGGLEPIIATEAQTKETGKNEGLAGVRVGTSEVSWDFEEIIHYFVDVFLGYG